MKGWGRGEGEGREERIREKRERGGRRELWRGVGGKGGGGGGGHKKQSAQPPSEYLVSES